MLEIEEARENAGFYFGRFYPKNLPKFQDKQYL